MNRTVGVSRRTCTQQLRPGFLLPEERNKPQTREQAYTNRYYEKRPTATAREHFWRHRYQDISAFGYLSRNGIAIRKFFLNVSKKEQKKRLMARLDIEEKNWKFSASDVKERKYWDEYQTAYEKTIRQTATEYAPWVVVPADTKWFSRLL